MIQFPISGVETYWWLPPLVAFAISCLTSTGGLSGAFLLLPFQVSVLGFTGPAVSPTNLVFNVIAAPGGVYRYCREKRMVWPLAAAIITGALPGILLGVFIRVTFLPDPKSFKPFVGFVLAYVGIRLLVDIFSRAKNSQTPSSPAQFTVTAPVLSLKQVGFNFQGITYRLSTLSIIAFGFVVGIISGAYGIGGGAIMAPFLVSVFGLPVYTIAGATLLSTFASAVTGVTTYTLISGLPLAQGLTTAPDWQLGVLFGIGGFAGAYVGARLQRIVPAGLIKAFLALSILAIAGSYISTLFR
jgi:hypothetical protein